VDEARVSSVCHNPFLEAPAKRRAVYRAVPSADVATPPPASVLRTGVFLDVDTVDTGDLDRSPLERVLSPWRWHRVEDPDPVEARLDGAAVAVTNKVVLDAACLARAAAAGLRLVCVAATGTNNVDLEAARRAGISVANVTGYATPAVVQHVFALVLALSTRLLDYRAAVAAGRWSASARFCLLDYPVREIAGKTLGIVGYGELGRGVARVAEAFGMEVLVAERRGAAPRPGRVALEALLPRVDVLTLHCPLTPETRDLIGAAELARMRSDAILINTARGGVVDEPALAAALRAGRLGGAGVDVLGREPPPVDHPLLAADVPNLIVTPHTAWASREARQRVIEEIARNIAAFAAGVERNRVV
jgi:glycerate dehydrogenase